MKKKVRIYKALDGQGKYINKTSQFLKKAQEGGMPDVNAMGYQDAQVNQQPSQDQIAQSIVADISNGRPKEETVMRLVNVFGQDPMSADQYYEQIFGALEKQNETVKSEVEDEEGDEVETVQPEQESKEDTGFYGDDSNNDLANQIADEDDDAYDDDDQVASDVIMQFGGVSPVQPLRQYGGNAIQFPGIDAYIPSNMSDILYGDTNAITQQAWTPVEQSSTGIDNEDKVDEAYRNGGQYKKDKRSYVNSVMKLVKKQMGGEDMSKNGDTDPRGEDVRKERLNAFLGTVKSQSQMAKAKEQAEQQFDQMMQQQQMMQQYPVEQPMAQLGMQMPRKGLFGRPKMPRGFGYGMQPITKLDVRRTGIFGRPKEYSMEFGMPGMIPGMQMPGMGAGFYGYGQTSKQGRTKGRIITEEIAKTVNNEASKEVASNTPGNTATDKSKEAESTANTPGSTANNIKTNTSTKRKNVEVNDEATDEVVNNSEDKREENKKTLLAQGLPGSSYEYAKLDNQWKYWDPIKQNYYNVGNKANLARLEAGENISSEYRTLKDKPGYYYRKAGDGSYIKFKGDPSKHTAQTKPVGKITKNQKKAFDYLEANAMNSLDENGYLNTLKFPNAPVPVNTPVAGAPMPSNYTDRLNLLNSYGRKYQIGGQAYYNPFGGIVDSENPDLYKFVYGGGDDASVPYLTQGDLDDVYSKDTSDPYFQYGGLKRFDGDKEGSETNQNFQWTVSNPNNIKNNFNPNVGSFANERYQEQPDFETRLAQEKKKWEQEYKQQQNPIAYNGYNAFGNLFPANAITNVGNWNKIQRGPYDPKTGMAIPGIGFGPNTQIQSIDVKRTGLLGRPKKYTINYGNQEMDPRKQNLISLPGQNATTGQSSDLIHQGKVDRAERRTARQMARGEKQFPETSSVNTPTSDIASTSNEPITTSTVNSDQAYIDKIHADKRAQGKEWNELSQSWVDIPTEKMELRKPEVNSLLSKGLQDRIKTDTLNANADKVVDENKEMLSELNMDPATYREMYLGQGKEAADKWVNSRIGERNSNLQAMYDYQEANKTPESEVEPQEQQIDNNYQNQLQQDYMESQGMGDLYQPYNPIENTTSLISNPLNTDYSLGYEPESDEYFDKGYFGNELIDRYDAYRKSQAPSNNYNKPLLRNNSSQSNTRQNPTVNNSDINNQNTFNNSIYDHVRNGSTEDLNKEYALDPTGSPEYANKFSSKRFPVGIHLGINSGVNSILENQQKQKVQDYNAKNNIIQKYEDNEINKYLSLKQKAIQDLSKLNLSNADKRSRLDQINKEYLQNVNKITTETNRRRQLLKASRKLGGSTNYFQPGGYVPQTPVVYTQNPALEGMSNVDMITLNEGIPDLQPNSFWNDQASFNKATPVNTQNQPEQIQIDPEQISSDQAQKVYEATPGNFSVDIRNKNIWEVDPEASLAVGNAGVRGLTGLFNRWKNKKNESKMYENLNADNEYAAAVRKNRGKTDVNSGLDFPSSQGALHTSRSKKYGGNSNYSEGEVVDMTEKELAEFLANGGQVEYL